MRLRVSRGWRLWLGLPLLAAAYVLLVLGTSRWLDGERVDLTRDRLYTLSPGTLDILANLQQPLELTLYFSDRASHGLPQVRAYHQRVVNLLNEVVRHAHGQVRFRQVDPLPFSEAEDRATAAGLTSVQSSQGTRGAIFFGLVGHDTVDGRKASIPFFLLAKERFVEYDLARLLYNLSVRQKPRIAIYSGLPIWGDGAGAAPWTMLQQLRQLFDVDRLDASALASFDGSGPDALVLIQPTALSQADVRAVDRYVQNGGRLLVFVDPDSEVAGDVTSDLPMLFRAWGVEFDRGEVLLDRSRALVVQSPTSGAAVRSPAVLGLTGDELNRRDPVTQSLSVINVSSTGYFGLLGDTDTRLEPLVQSTTDAMTVPAGRVRETLDPSALYKDYRPDGRHFAIAVRLHGQLSPAFPDDAAAATSGRTPKVILVGDTDLLSDRLWVQTSASQNQTLVTPFANNGDFFVNAVDALAGPSDLIAIRGRGVAERRFTRVDALRRQADEKFRARQNQLESELAATERHIDALRQGARNTGNDSNGKATVEASLERKIELRRQLREVQRSLDADIERLSMQLKFIDILLMPLLLTLLGLAYGAIRVRRRRGGRVSQ